MWNSTVIFVQFRCQIIKCYWTITTPLVCLSSTATFPWQGQVEQPQRLYGLGILSCLLLGLLRNGSTVENPSAMQETWVQCLGPEHPLEKEMATHSNILTRKCGEQRSLTGYSPWGRKRVGHDLATKQQQNKEKVWQVLTHKGPWDPVGPDCFLQLLT